MEVNLLNCLLSRAQITPGLNLQRGWKYCNGKYCNGVGNIATPLEILQPLLDLKFFVGNIATNFREQVFLAWYIFSCHEQKKIIKLGERLLGLLVLWLFWTLKWSIRHKLGPSRAIRGPREHARSNCESIRIELIVAFPARSNTSYVFFLSPSLHWTVMRLERQLESFF